MTQSMVSSRSFSALYPRLPSKLRELANYIITFNRYTLLMWLYHSKESYLRKSGWFESIEEGIPVTCDGEPIPWFSYPTIEFLRNCVTEEHSVFEYGSGSSTPWFEKRAERVVAVEQSEYWYDFVNKRLSDGGELILGSDDESGSLIPEGEEYDIIVADGIGKQG